MRKAILSLILVLSATILPAQTFTSLWKQYEVAVEKDQPKTSLTILRQIQQKSEDEQNYGNLFAAWTAELAQQREVSDDSLRVAVLRLEDRRQSLAKSSPIAATILQTALWKYRFSLDNYGVSVSMPRVDSLMHSVDSALYLNADDDAAYAPFVKTELGSRYFNNDLLHLIAFETDQLSAIKPYYGEKAQAIIEHREFNAKYDLTTEQRIAYIDAELAKWGKWEGVDALREQRVSLTTPMFDARCRSNVITANEELVVNFRTVRNINKVTVKISDGKRIVRTATKKFVGHKDYESFKDSIIVGCLPLGEYKLQLVTDCKQMPVEKESLYVSNLAVLGISLPGDRMRFVAVDATSGQPVPGAKLTLSYSNQKSSPEHYTTGKDGEIVIKPKFNYYQIKAETAVDKAMPPTHVSRFYNYSENKTQRNYQRIYTDRNIYRPGQKVQVAVIAYALTNGTETMVCPGIKIPLQVFDAKSKLVGTDTLTTDAFGTASTEITLPENGNNGTYFIFTKDATESFRVEEYVRPTFDVTIDRPTIAYHAGDTVIVKGKAMTYSGAPVGNARVVYDVNRRTPVWWRSYGMPSVSNAKTLLTDTVHTNADGTFELRMPMVMKDDSQDDNAESVKTICHFYNIFAEATVTDVAGESHSAYISLPLSDREAYLTCDIPERILADSAVNVTITRYNAAGEKIDGNLKLYIDNTLTYEGTIKNSPFGGWGASLGASFPSGRHTFTAICEGDTITRNFTVFRLTDERPVEETHDWWYQTSGVFPATEDSLPHREGWGGSSVQFGTSDHNTCVFYALYSGNKVLESGQLQLDSALHTRRFDYKPEYGDGIVYTIAWVKDGKTYRHTANIKRQLPDKKLKVEWGTFRNKVVPGDKEEWTLRISHPDGTPAKAQLMATLFDKSLDAINRHYWSLQDPRSISLPGVSWHIASFNSLYLSGWATPQNVNYKHLAFSHINDDYGFFGGFRSGMLRNVKVRGKAGMYKSAAALESVVATDEVALNGKISGLDMKSAPLMAKANAEESKVFDVVESMPAFADDMASAEEEVITVRSNLAETAAFFPAVETDGNGVASLRFTLPESVTTWRFIGLAHDKDMRFGMIDDEAVAQKLLMVQPRVPRFLRADDKAVIPVSVVNLSESDQMVKVSFTLLDAATEKPLMRAPIYNKVEVKAGETIATEFALDASKYADSEVIVRVTAVTLTDKKDAATYSDGEQYLLPILSDREWVVNTRPMVISKPGTTNVNIADMLPKGATDATLTVNYTDNPQWLLIDALPYVTGTIDDNAISLATALYCNALAAYICDVTADDTTEETQKLTSHYDRKALSYRAQDILSRLSLLQNADGSWSWWRGMLASRHVSMEVYRTLVRLRRLAGFDYVDNLVGSNTLGNLLKRADKYLSSEIAKDVKDMKKHETKQSPSTLSHFHLDYLYSQDKVSGSDQRYLYDHLEKSTVGSDMATKSKAAIIFNANGNSQKAGEYIESIIQHTVYREDIGRYFDSYRTAYSWCDYRIPTQTLAIEAISSTSSATSSSTLTEMQRWLLSSKRTQQWDTPINAVNAIHAFFGGKASHIKKSVPAAIKLDGKLLMDNPVEMPIDAKAKKLSINKTSDTESWVAVSVAFRQPQKDIASSESGLKVIREVKGEAMAVGTKVKVVITVTADRDYDFVTITDNRAACLDPVHQLSGYGTAQVTFEDSRREYCYTVQHDSNTEYYFDTFRKGTHRIETEYYISREGTYTAGTATAVCTYAPEFTGRTTAVKLIIDPNK